MCARLNVPSPVLVTRVVAAVLPIVEEAGGRVTGMDGSPFNPVAAHLVATNGPLQAEMLGVIREYRSGRARNGTG